MLRDLDCPNVVEHIGLDSRNMTVKGLACANIRAAGGGVAVETPQGGDRKRPGAPAPGLPDHNRTWATAWSALSGAPSRIPAPGPARRDRRTGATPRRRCRAR